MSYITEEIHARNISLSLNMSSINVSDNHKDRYICEVFRRNISSWQPTGKACEDRSSHRKSAKFVLKI